ncbi:type I restriction endonuclease [Vogesella indigofera]|uniref:type I restriction endonuclease n=1 Tax=Vogesella indigofera TaxID=45465 RepID=UPI00234E8897|nr:type I restriction endonuclease [Vogesella indigofera]MDC7706240.1 type I restriction endonuclease [Vogesella indigofera]
MMTEDQLEQETLGWLTEAGYTRLFGPDLAPEGSNPERADYRQVLLLERLQGAIARLNPTIPLVAREDALRQVQDLGIPALLSANRRFHQLLVGGVPVEYQKDGETRGDFVRLVDWANPAANEWLAVSQFSIKGPHHTRRPDIILFLNGLPLVLLELKNPADENADIWKGQRLAAACTGHELEMNERFQQRDMLIAAFGLGHVVLARTFDDFLALINGRRFVCFLALVGHQLLKASLDGVIPVFTTRTLKQAGLLIGRQAPVTLVVILWTSDSIHGALHDVNPPGVDGHAADGREDVDFPVDGAVPHNIVVVATGELGLESLAGQGLLIGLGTLEGTVGKGLGQVVPVSDGDFVIRAVLDGRHGPYSKK